MSSPRWAWVGIAPVLIVLLGHTLTARRSPAGDLRSVAQMTVAPPRLVGSGRCSAVACHGNATPVGGMSVLGNEHTTWATRDPHAEAYDTLFSDLSRTIARNLGKGSGPVVSAHRDARCLACHVTLEPTGALTSDPGLHRNGVDCEACHGAASNWLSPHTSYEWRGLPSWVKDERYGMRETKDLVRRGELCAGCHVGAPAGAGQPSRDVDHDLIAAGHPRLNFEFSGFLANLPSHWLEKGRNRSADFPARTWAIGQVVAARSALSLLDSRAAPAHHARWPEFAEYQCASCHHDLSMPSLRPAASSASRLAGTPAWGTWYFRLMSEMARHEGGPSELAAQLQELRTTMEQPLPDRHAAAAQAAAASETLRRWLGSVSTERFDPPKLQTLMRHIRTPSTAGSTWTFEGGDDDETQRYLALVPLRQALVSQGLDQPGLREALIRWQERLTRVQSRGGKMMDGR
jgi:predicted CxxxxCH...CXXCH cytochrome family protein